MRIYYVSSSDTTYEEPRSGWYFSREVNGEPVIYGAFSSKEMAAEEAENLEYDFDFGG